MANRLKFSLKLSLEELAIRKVVVSLWNEGDVLASIPRFQTCQKFKFLDEYKEAWRITVENKVKSRVGELELTERLKERVMFIVEPIGLQLQEWYILNEEDLDPSRKCLGQLCWKSTGAVDYRKTNEKLIRLATFDVTKRFEAACQYCLEDSISVLYEELPERYKSYFYSKMHRFAVTDMEMYWVYSLKKEESKLDEIYGWFLPSGISTFHQFAFFKSASEGNRAATEHFFQKLTNQERDKFLVNIVCDIAVRLSGKAARFELSDRHLSDVLCYLLSVMSPEQWTRAFERNRSEILNCFQNLPEQVAYFDIAVVTFPQEI